MSYKQDIGKADVRRKSAHRGNGPRRGPVRRRLRRANRSATRLGRAARCAADGFLSVTRQPHPDDVSALPAKLALPSLWTPVPPVATAPTSPEPAAPPTAVAPPVAV